MTDLQAAIATLRKHLAINRESATQGPMIPVGCEELSAILDAAERKGSLIAAEQVIAELKEERAALKAKCGRLREERDLWQHTALVSAQGAGDVVPLTAEQRMFLRTFAASEAMSVLKEVDAAPACDDGMVSALDLGHAREQVAWGLCQADLLLAEQIGNYKDVDGQPLPEWGFMVNETGAGAILAAALAHAQVAAPDAGEESGS